MKFDHFPRTSPHALPAIRTSLLYNRDARFQELDRILGTDAHAAAAVVAFAGDDMDHQRGFSLHE